MELQSFFSVDAISIDLGPYNRGNFVADNANFEYWYNEQDEDNSSHLIVAPLRSAKSLDEFYLCAYFTYLERYQFCAEFQRDEIEVQFWEGVRIEEVVNFTRIKPNSIKEIESNDAVISNCIRDVFLDLDDTDRVIIYKGKSGYEYLFLNCERIGILLFM